MYCRFVAVPAVLNEAVPAAMHDVENELKHVLVDVSRYTGSSFHIIYINSFCLSERKYGNEFAAVIYCRCLKS